MAKTDEEKSTILSPAVARTAAVLNFLAEHPDEAFTLSEISKSLRMSSATCHNLLTSLTEFGYVYRTAGKTYVLGSALIRIANIALDGVSTLQVARPEMRNLADEYDVVCNASFLEGDEVIVKARAASVSHLGWHYVVHQRYPFRPPLGPVFIAWEDPDSIENWLKTAEEPLSEADREGLMGNMAFLRQHGFAFVERTVPLSDWGRARELQSAVQYTNYVTTDLEQDREYQLAAVTAPVFSIGNRVEFILSLSGFVAPVNGEQIRKIGMRLRESCDRIGNYMAGKLPSSGIL